MAVKLNSSNPGEPLAPGLDAVQWRLALNWLDQIDATERAAERSALLRALHLTQPATASAVLHLLELRRCMNAAEFLAVAWPASVPIARRRSRGG